MRTVHTTLGRRALEGRDVFLFLRGGPQKGTRAVTWKAGLFFFFLRKTSRHRIGTQKDDFGRRPWKRNRSGYS